MSAAAAAAAAASSGSYQSTGVIVPGHRGHCERRERRGCKAGVIVGAAVVAAGAAYLYERHKCHRECDMRGSYDYY